VFEYLNQFMWLASLFYFSRSSQEVGSGVVEIYKSRAQTIRKAKRHNHIWEKDFPLWRYPEGN
jgi:hypothetical protein